MKYGINANVAKVLFELLHADAKPGQRQMMGEHASCY